VPKIPSDGWRNFVFVAEKGSLQCSHPFRQLTLLGRTRRPKTFDNGTQLCEFPVVASNLLQQLKLPNLVRRVKHLPRGDYAK